MTSTEQKKKPNDGEVREAKNRLLRFIEEYQEALSHPWKYEEYMGLGHVFDAPEGAVSKHVKRPTTPEEVKSVAQQTEQSILSKLDRIISAGGGGQPLSEMGAEEPIGEISEN